MRCSTWRKVFMCLRDTQGSHFHWISKSYFILLSFIISVWFIPWKTTVSSYSPAAEICADQKVKILIWVLCSYYHWQHLNFQLYLCTIIPGQIPNSFKTHLEINLNLIQILKLYKQRFQTYVAMDFASQAAYKLGLYVGCEKNCRHYTWLQKSPQLLYILFKKK